MKPSLFQRAVCTLIISSHSGSTFAEPLPARLRGNDNPIWNHSTFAPLQPISVNAINQTIHSNGTDVPAQPRKYYPIWPLILVSGLALMSITYGFTRCWKSAEQRRPEKKRVEQVPLLTWQFDDPADWALEDYGEDGPSLQQWQTPPGFQDHPTAAEKPEAHFFYTLNIPERGRSDVLHPQQARTQANLELERRREDHALVTLLQHQRTTQIAHQIEPHLEEDATFTFEQSKTPTTFERCTQGRKAFLYQLANSQYDYKAAASPDSDDTQVTLPLTPQTPKMPLLDRARTPDLP